MFRGVYSATSGMIASQRKQELLTNNLANAATPGYKQDHTLLRSFPDILIHRIRDEQGPKVQGLPSLPGQARLGTLHTGVYTQEAIPLFSQGDLQETGRSVDIALLDQDLRNPANGEQGHLFFTVQTNENELRYTRNGQFAISPEGFLTTSDGHLVLVEQGEGQDPAPLQMTNADFKVVEDGRIILDPNDPASLANAPRLWLAYTEEPQRLIKEGNGLLNWVGEAGAEGGAPQLLWRHPDFVNDPTAPLFQLKQGFIERSNVDATQTMTEMLSTFRLYEANQRVLQAYDRSLDKLVNEVGRVF